jgi:hypothetical protein
LTGAVSHALTEAYLFGCSGQEPRLVTLTRLPAPSGLLQPEAAVNEAADVIHMIFVNQLQSEQCRGDAEQGLGVGHPRLIVARYLVLKIGCGADKITELHQRHPLFLFSRILNWSAMESISAMRVMA